MAMRITENLIARFAEWVQLTEFEINDRTVEASIQLQLGIFLSHWRSPKTKVEMERNCKDLVPVSRQSTKKEIDVYLECGRQRSAIEVKYGKMSGASNLTMIGFAKDIQFGEDLIASGFTSFGALLITNVNRHHKDPKDNKVHPTHPENLALLERFRIERRLYGDMDLKIGQKTEKVSLKGNYPINWRKFSGTTQYCIVVVNSERAATSVSHPSRASSGQS